MKIRAVICDVYKTLLQVAPPPADAEERWAALCLQWLPGISTPTLATFHAQSERLIAREHTAAHATGIAYPEIYWPTLATEALPPLATLSPKALDEFLFHHSALTHTLRLMPGAAHGLRTLARRRLPLGIASNAQPYTLEELSLCLASENLSLSLFNPEFTFWSFQHGFSKPDPHVFRLLTTRLSRLGIHPGETLMVGDRLDNDIEPARAQGWQTWCLSSPSDTGDGDWNDLCNTLE